MNDIKPWSVLIIIGGIAMAVSSFLNWNQILFGEVAVAETGWDKGMLGLYQLIIGVIVTLFGFAQMGGRTDFPNIATLSLNQWIIALSVAVAIWGFGLQFDNNPEIGILITWVGGVIAAAGATMSERARTSDNDVPRY